MLQAHTVLNMPPAGDSGHDVPLASEWHQLIHFDGKAASDEYRSRKKIADAMTVRANKQQEQRAGGGEQGRLWGQQLRSRMRSRHKLMYCC
jgi:non-ribosomal peptide synthetase component F